MSFNSSTDGIFSTPITTISGEPVSKEVLDFIKNLEFIPSQKNDSTLSMTKENQVLDAFKELCNLKESILKIADFYWRDVLSVDTSLKPVIRHSWITRHKSGEFNPMHHHTTSLFSITTYLQASPNCGNLIFKKDKHHLNLFPSIIDLDFYSKNLFNAKTHSVTPTSGLSVCFPSHLDHYTEPNCSDDERYALNVDFWVSGETRKNTNFKSVF